MLEFCDMLEIDRFDKEESNTKKGSTFSKFSGFIFIVYCFEAIYTC